VARPRPTVDHVAQRDRFFDKDAMGGEASPE